MHRVRLGDKPRAGKRVAGGVFIVNEREMSWPAEPRARMEMPPLITVTSPLSPPVDDARIRFKPKYLLFSPILLILFVAIKCNEISHKL